MRFSQRQQCIELAALQALEVFARVALINHPPLVHHVGQTVGHPGVGGLSITPTTAGFLVVGLDVFRQVQVRDKAHVGFVDAHAKSDGRDHHDAVFAQEAVLVLTSNVSVQASVVGQCRDAFVVQPGGGFINALAALAINDARVAVVFVAQEAQQLFARLVFFDDGVAQVGAVKTGHKKPR